MKLTKNYALNDSLRTRIQNKGARPAPVLEDEISRFPGQCPLRRWLFSHWFSGKGVGMGAALYRKKYVKCDIQCHHINAFMLHGSKWKQSGIFLEAFQDIMFQHLADQPFLPASQRVFRARSPEMALVRSTFKDWQKIRFGCLVFPAHSNDQEKYQAFQLVPSFTSNNSHVFGTVYYLYYLLRKFLQNYIPCTTHEASSQRTNWGTVNCPICGWMFVSSTFDVWIALCKSVFFSFLFCSVFVMCSTLFIFVSSLIVESLH